MTRKDLQKFVEADDDEITVLTLILTELRKARSKHEDMNSAHEGYAVILEELDELWEEIKKQERSHIKIAEEAIQVAAMGCRFLIDICRNGKL